MRFLRGASAAFLVLAAAAVDPGAAARSQPAPATPITAPGDAASTPAVSILDRYQILGLYEVGAVISGRADYSGLAVRSEDSTRVTLWLAHDKPDRMEDALCRLTLRLPAAPEPGMKRVRPERLPVRNPGHLPTGGDIEDLAWVPPGNGAAGLLAVVGEAGPHGQPKSWFYLLREDSTGLRLETSFDASPENESVGNNGLEGVAARRSPLEGLVEVYVFKERPAPVYAREYRISLQGGRDVPDAGRTFHWIGGMVTQSGACFDPSGEWLCVIDRQERRIAVVEAGTGGPGLEGLRRGREVLPREWLEFAPVDSLLEGNTGGTPPSLFGAVEGIAVDRRGRLYLLSDNNEVRHSRILVLRPRPGR